MIGRIHRILANDHEVHTPEGTLHCRFRGRLKRERLPVQKLAAVGDEVEVSDSGAGEGVIEALLPRRSKLSRRDAFRPSREQVIVANVDVLLIVQAARDPDFNDLIVDQCTVMAACNGLTCVVVVNKSDLAGPDLTAYEGAGFRCIRTSARDGRGLDELRTLLDGRTCVFLGPSGVGKSSLLNALRPDLGLKVGDVSRRGEGRHTTSWVELVPVAGGLAADTPGLEFFTLWGVTPDNLKGYFLDFVDLAGDCRYRDCSHAGEPDCAVVGRVAASRHRNYLRIREKLRAREALFS
jgi:ribosome biogenesis GTPase